MQEAVGSVCRIKLSSHADEASDPREADRRIGEAFEQVEARHDEVLEERLAPVRAWASGLDRDTYLAQQTDTGLYIQSTPPDEVVQALQDGKDELHHAQEATRLFVRYYVEPKKGTAADVPADKLAADLAIARELIDNPHEMSADDLWDAPTAVAAAALSAHLLRGVGLTDDLLTFAVDLVLRVGAGEGSQRQFEFEETYFQQGADRSAARAFPAIAPIGNAVARTRRRRW